MPSYYARINFQVAGLNRVTEAATALTNLEQRVQSLKGTRINLNPITKANYNRYDKFVNSAGKVPESISTKVNVSGLTELQTLEKSIRYLNRNKNININVNAKTSDRIGSVSSSSSSTLKPRTVYIRNSSVYQDGYKKRPTTYGNVSRNGYDIYGFNADTNATFQAARPVLTMNRRLSTVTEKLNNVAGRFMLAASYVGGQDLSKIILETPAKAEVQKYLLGNMQGTDAVFDKTTNASTSLYQTLDKTTDQLPISMQNVVQPLYAFKAASGATAQEINNIIPAFANFGAQVINMTGSEEQAEEAMQKLSRAYQGQYAAVDQYGITKESLERAGYQEGGTIEEFMAAVDKITGDARDSMNNFNGVKQLVSKDFARSGKHIWEGGFGQALTGMLKGFHELDQGLGGFPTEILTVGGSVLSMATQISGATAAIGITISTFAQLTATMSQARKAGGGLGSMFKSLLFGGFKEAKGEHPGADFYSSWDGAAVKTSTYEGTYEGTVTGIKSAMPMGAAGATDMDGKPTPTTSSGAGKSQTTKSVEKLNKSNEKLTNSIEKTNKENKDSQNKLTKTIEKQKPIQTEDIRYNNAMKNLKDYSKGKYTPSDIPSPVGGSKFTSMLANPDLLAQVEQQRKTEISNQTKKNRLLKEEVGLRKKLSGSLTSARKRLGGVGSSIKNFGSGLLTSNYALLGFGALLTGAYTWLRYAEANNQKAAQGIQIFNNSLSQAAKNIVANIGNIAHDLGLSTADGIEGAAEATGTIAKNVGLVIQTWTGQNHKYYIDDNGEVQKYTDKEYYGWETENGTSEADKLKKKQMDMMSSWTDVASGTAGFFDWIGKVATGESFGMQEVIDQKFAKSRENLAAGKKDKFFEATGWINRFFNPTSWPEAISEGFSWFINGLNSDIGKVGNTLGISNMGSSAHPFNRAMDMTGLSGIKDSIISGITSVLNPTSAGNDARSNILSGLNIGQVFNQLTGQGGGENNIFKSIFDPNNINSAEISTNITTKTNEALQTASPQIKQASVEAMKGVGEGMGEGLSEGNSALDTKLSDVENTLRSKNSTYADIAHTGGVDASNRFGDGIGDMSSITSGEMDEIVSAIRNAIPQVQSAASDLGAAIPNSANQQMDYHSPGRLARMVAGEMGEVHRAIVMAKNPVSAAASAIGRAIVDGGRAVERNGAGAYGFVEDASILNTNNNGGAGGNVINNTFNIGSVDSKERVKEIAEAVAYIFNFNNETAGRNTDVGVTNNVY